MSRRISITQRFGRLVVDSVGKPADPRGGGRFWICRCDCGGTVEVSRSKLLGGSTKSCGCLAREVSARTGRATVTHGMTRTPTYRSWCAMKARCLNVRHPKYRLYGGSGVFICQRWLDSFEDFVADVGERPDGLTLDRFPNPAGNYEPSNVRWATAKEQRNNRRVK